MKAFYDNIRINEPFYTDIPEFYWKANALIPTWEYVRNRTKESNITPSVLFKACENFPEIFSYYMLGILLRPYQHYGIDIMNQNNQVAFDWSRRLGKTTTCKIYELWTARFNKLPGTLTGTTWNNVLQDQETGNELYIEPLHEIMENGDAAVEKNFKGVFGEHFFTDALVTRRDKAGKVKSNQISMRTETGVCRIRTYAPTKKAIGKEGNTMGDEVSKWKNNNACKDEFTFYDQFSAITKDRSDVYKEFYLSTPEGADDLFAKEIFDPDEQIPNHRFKRVWFPWSVRTDENWINEMLRTREDFIRKGRLFMFMQEYEAKFVSVSNPYFANHTIFDRLNSAWARGMEQTPCSLGIDWGGTTKSETAWAITSWNTKPDAKREIIAMKTYPVGDDLYQFEPDMKILKSRYNIKWVIPDNKGGRWMMPVLEGIFGKARVEPFNFTTDKKAGYDRWNQAITNGLAPLPNYVPLIKQMQGMSNDLKPASTQGKDDLADACMMSMWPLFPKPMQGFRVLRY